MAAIVAGGVWGAVGGVTALSVVVFFILTITLLSLCTSCKGESFDLQHNTSEERTSTLVRVVSLEHTALAMSNPASVMEKGEQGDRNDIRNLNPQRLNSTPPAVRPPVKDSNQQSVGQTVSTNTENTPSTHSSHSQLPYSHVSFEHQTKDGLGASSNTGHTYESIREKKVDDQTGTLLNPYATHNSSMTHGPPGNGPSPPAAPPLAEDFAGGSGRTDFPCYATVNKNGRC
ncbi:uncharacterized protein LOC143481019 [Brachyhypopomus gauderio]|uniref:uncharacterized protein LOC143481019 n=1 Tax=Brachyhypopomus gauderio TaxID=698409 RepID=UPI0040430E72